MLETKHLKLELSLSSLSFLRTQWINSSRYMFEILVLSVGKNYCAGSNLAASFTHCFSLWIFFILLAIYSASSSTDAPQSPFLRAHFIIFRNDLKAERWKLHENRFETVHKWNKLIGHIIWTHLQNSLDIFL